MSIVNRYSWRKYDPDRIYKTSDGSWRTGHVYLLHFERLVDGHRHYVGWTGDLRGRLLQHLVGEGSELSIIAAARDVRFVDSSIPGTHEDECALQGAPDAVLSQCGVCSRVVCGRETEARRLVRFRLDWLGTMLHDLAEPAFEPDAWRLERARRRYGAVGDVEPSWFELGGR